MSIARRESGEASIQLINRSLSKDKIKIERQASQSKQEEQGPLKKTKSSGNLIADVGMEVKEGNTSEDNSSPKEGKEEQHGSSENSVLKSPSRRKKKGSKTKGNADQNSLTKLLVDQIPDEVPDSDANHSAPTPHLKDPVQEDAYQTLPTLKVLQLREKVQLSDLQGPDDHTSWTESMETFSSFIAAKAVSTYPHIPGRLHREGDPICDSFFLRVYSNRVVCALADGCSWGNRPLEAARVACKAFMDYMTARMDDIVDVQECGHCLLRAFDKASREIIVGKDDIWDAGTTTLIGGVLLELEDNKWGFLCVSVGDCKAFRYSIKNKEVIDVTQGNRRNLTNPSDPGGRLGPYLENGSPDLRNLKIYFVECVPNDLLILVSDGVHDNLDPQHLGKEPKDFNIGSESWEEAEKEFPVESERAKNNFRKEIVRELISSVDKNDGVPSPKLLAEKVLDHCKTVTEMGRVWMQENPTKRLPPDYIRYPGKMDHSSCVVLRVGPFQTGQE